MAVPKVDGQFIAEAIKYIDENGVPWHNTSTKYELVQEKGKTYPPKYVIAVANHLQNGAEIDVSGYNAVEAKNYLTAKGYEIQIKQTKYEITITSDSVTSTDDSFTMDNISAGDVFKPLDASFVAVDGTVIKRNYGKGERRNTNQTLPRIAFQIYEKQMCIRDRFYVIAFRVVMHKYYVTNGKKYYCDNGHRTQSDNRPIKRHISQV